MVAAGALHSGSATRQAHHRRLRRRRERDRRRRHPNCEDPRRVRQPVGRLVARLRALQDVSIPAPRLLVPHHHRPVFPRYRGMREAADQREGVREDADGAHVETGSDRVPGRPHQRFIQGTGAYQEGLSRCTAV